MDLYADDARIVALESGLQALGPGARARAMVELSWYLRERDTKRAHALAAEAGALAAACERTTEATRVSARAQLILGECALLFREMSAARAGAHKAFELFESIHDALGLTDVQFLRTRIARVARDETGAHDSAVAAFKAAEIARDRPRLGFATLALASAHGRLPETPDLAAFEDIPVVECHRDYLDAQSHLRAGAFEPAIELFSRAARQAIRLGMDELSLECELAIARTLGALGDFEAAIATGERVLDAARLRGWRGTLAAATASVCGWLLELDRGAAALELLVEARASLAGLAPSRRDASLDLLRGQAELATGCAETSARTFSEVVAALRGKGPAHLLPRALAMEARALAAAGQADAALTRATQALDAARETRERVGEMRALHALGEIHAARRHGDDRAARSSIAFLRHAAEIAAEIGDPASQAQIASQIATLHEANGDCASALAAQRLAQARADEAAQRRAGNRAIAARAQAIRERQRLQERHARAIEEAGSRHSSELARAYGMVDGARALAQEVAEAGDPAILVECLERKLREAVSVDLIALFVFDASGRSLQRYAREGGRAVPVRQVPAADLESYAARAAREQRELHIEVETARPGDAAEMRDASTLWYGPIASGGNVLGVLTVQSRQPRAYGERDRILLRTVGGHVALSLARSRMQEELRCERALRIDTEEQLRRLATVDALTGLATRAQFFSLARERLERARRDGGPCGLIIADVDGFKAINDTRGMAAGDRILAAVAAMLASGGRCEDVAGRIGGEEFALILPGASLESTVAAAERMRSAIEALHVTSQGRQRPVTMSFGCSALADARAEMGKEPAAETLERLVREADAALYEAQGTGGNRTIAWPAYQALRALRTGESIERTPQSFA